MRVFRLVSGVVAFSSVALIVACSDGPESQSEDYTASEQALNPGSYQTYYAGRDGNEWGFGRTYTANTQVKAMSGTSPCTTPLQAGTYGAAYQGSNGFLYVTGETIKNKNTGYGMSKGTSPSCAGMMDEPWALGVAFQANTSTLWVYEWRQLWSSGRAIDTGYGMMPGTSPSMAALPGGGFDIAFQANTGHLWVVGTHGNVDTGIEMMQGTSPSIAALPNGGYVVAYQAPSGFLWVTGTLGTGNTQLGMMPGTSPSIVGLPNDGWEVAFQANTGFLWVGGTLGTGDTGYGMMAGTSPSITAFPAGGYEVAFQANTGRLWLTGTQTNGDTGYAMLAGTSPSISQVNLAPTNLKTSTSVSDGATKVTLWWDPVPGAISYEPSLGCAGHRVVTGTTASWTDVGFSMNCQPRVYAKFANGLRTASRSTSVTTPKNPGTSTGGSTGGTSTAGAIQVYYDLQGPIGSACGSTAIVLDGVARTVFGVSAGVSENGERTDPGNNWCYYNTLFDPVSPGTHTVCGYWGTMPDCKTVVVEAGRREEVRI